MARPLDPRRRQELLDRSVDCVIAIGVSDMSLRLLAADVGRQAPVLLHHFGSKEQLVADPGLRARATEVARAIR
jgi:AcrR family transcriptional regulator